MKKALANDAIALEYGGNTVFLRPSLRAALHLECLHDGFPNLLSKIQEFDTFTVKKLIASTAGIEAAQSIFSYASRQPLKEFQDAAQKPCFELVSAFFPEAPEITDRQSSSAKPTPWRDLFSEFFGFATGWLGWPPETAWNATPQEISDAFRAHVTKLKAIYGDPEDVETIHTEEQGRENLEHGLDPEFDRAGLRALKDLSTLREGMTA